jgi:hypothetical protein
MRYQAVKPTREQLCGYSPSELKTLIKLKGYKIPRDFFKRGSFAKKGNRLYRFRHWGDVYSNTVEFEVDISCPLCDFDRWANSKERTLTFYEWFGE